MKRATAVLAPGWNGTANQPLLVALSKALEGEGIAALRMEFTRSGKPSPDYAREISELKAAAARAGKGRVALVGRSFGGRICTFAALEAPPDALVVLGYPIRPPGRPRPRDEAALAAVSCPTLIVQGDGDELGPLRVLKAAAKKNRRVEIAVLKGCGHSLRAREAVALATGWLAERLRR